MERPTEDTYVAELVSVIQQIGRSLGFDAEHNKNTPSGKPDVILFFRDKVVAVIEVKGPKIALSDSALNKQALGYADWYRKNRGVKFYGIHNMKFLKLFKYVAGEKREKTLLDFVGEKRADWASVSDFPFKIMPWVKSIDEYKQISVSRDARKNLEELLLRFKEILEGKTLDLSKDVIETVRRYIEEGAGRGLTKLEDLHRRNEQNIRDSFEEWRKERGIEKPKNDNQPREFLTLMLKEQLYTFSMKVLFYFVLQSIDAEMAAKLQQDFASVELSDSKLFKQIFDILFSYAIDKTGDFEEVFKTNTVDRLPFVEQTLQPLKEIISYLNQIRWSEINVDIIGRVFEGLIYTERRHMLGQHYTDTMVVDLIPATLRKPEKLIDPACGSGTFPVRALNYWKANYGSSSENYTLVEGIDIDKLASMLSKINLYIQALEEIKEKTKYFPKIYHKDFFKAELPLDYSYVTTNPPYTRQEEMTMAFYDKQYKKYLAQAVKDIADWSKRASIYAYFLVGAAKLLKKGGRLGFIVENSWLNAEYGGSLKNWFLDYFTIEYIIESLAERWFEDAAVITNIIVAERSKNDEYATKFVYLKKKLQKILGAPPPSRDLIANQRYYEKIGNLFLTPINVSTSNDYVIYDNDNARIVLVKKSMLEIIEKKLGKWGIIKGPKKYLEIVLKFLEDQFAELRFFGETLDLKYGIKTDANEIFYLPSKHWTYREDDRTYLRLSGPSHRSLKISKKLHLRPLIRPTHIENSSYEISTIKKERHEDYILWVEDTSKVEDQGTRDYLEWAKAFIIEEHETDNSRFPTLAKQVESPTWTKMLDKSGAKFLLKNDIHRNFAIYVNGILDSQVDKRLFLGHPKMNVDDRIIFAVLNSVFTYLGMELIGRSNLGEGALDINFVDYEKIPVVDPLALEKRLREEDKFQDFLQVVNEMLKRKPLNLEFEAKNDIRLKMEEYVLKTLDLNKNDILSFYKELETLINLRAERAASFK